jgi:signal peptidase I
MSDVAKPAAQETNIVDVLQSLIVAFVLAMAFRGFVLEGFVIPSGSMAPTLMGQHVRWTSDVTGWQFPFDGKNIVDRITQLQGRADIRSLPAPPLCDPMIGPDLKFWSPSMVELGQRARMGDRVLVMKAMYLLGKIIPIFAPSRWDVVVFKCPTDPVGEKQNYIKRLVGLPNESFLFADGDLFTAAADVLDAGKMHVQRKPEYIQRAVWQPVYDSDYIPVDITRAGEMARRDVPGPPWSGGGWATSDLKGPSRVYRCDRSSPTLLRWDDRVRRIDDWNAYNMQMEVSTIYPVSDLRVCAAVEADQPANLKTSFRLQARSHNFDFMLGDGQATLRVTRTEDDLKVGETTTPFSVPTTGSFAVEFWHVDQCLTMFVDGTKVAELPYDWSARERLQNAMVGRTIEDYRRAPELALPQPPTITWSFEGSPVSMQRVRLDRDLYYRPAQFSGGRVSGDFAPTSAGLGFGIDPDHPAVLGPDHFLMCGDNSPASQDGRIWGAAHGLAEIFIEPTPFVVHRRLLLGKAWSVYLPSPVPMGTSGRTLIPDFGRLRFIR